MFARLKNRLKTWGWRFRGYEVVQPLNIGTAAGALLMQEQFNRIHNEIMASLKHYQATTVLRPPVETDWPEIIE